MYVCPLFCVHLVPTLCVCVSILCVLGTHSVRVGVCVCVCLRFVCTWYLLCVFVHVCVCVSVLCALSTHSVCVCACVSMSIFCPAFYSASAQALYHLRLLTRLSQRTSDLYSGLYQWPLVYSPDIGSLYHRKTAVFSLSADGLCAVQFWAPKRRLLCFILLFYVCVTWGAS